MVLLKALSVDADLVSKITFATQMSGVLTFLSALGSVCIFFFFYTKSTNIKRFH